MSEPEGFFTRWSRRKRAEREAPPPAETPEAAEATAAEPEPLEGPPLELGPREGPPREAPPLELPPLELLTKETDFRLFLREGVPEAIRHAALRRLWSLDPAIRDFTNALDYGWDFNAPDGGMAGFSNTLAGDVEKLLRQAVGMLEEPAREAAEEPVAAPQEPLPLLAGPPPDFIPPAFAPPAEPAPEPEPLPQRSRHGGAMPA